MPCLLLCGAATAQLLTVSPAFPQDNSSITITVDCSKGNQGLFNYANTSDVFVHVGVITNLSSNNGDWKYVKFTWPGTDPASKASYLGSNKYQYTINNIRSFFGVPAGETIRKVAILFRNGTGSQVQRIASTSVDNGNMYIAVYDNSLATQFLQPPFEPRFTPVADPISKETGNTIDLQYISNQSANLQLFFNGTPLGSAANATTISFSPVITAAGNQQIVGRAILGAVTISDTINFVVSPPNNVQPLPAGVRDGINYDADNSSVTLVLFAPNKNKVSVIGDFNNWTADAASQLNKTPDGQRFWIRLTGLTPGTEYGYQYVVDNSLRIADPYTQKVLDPANDPYITAATYPNLKPYPTGKATGIVSVLQTAEPAYTWQTNNFTRPDKRNLMVYELLVRDFVGNHDWVTLKDTLSYLKRLGINAIELMPFNEFEGNISWGYNTSFYFAPDKYYGTKNGLKAFIDECHKQGIAVIMDMVLNHAFGQSPMVQLYWDAANNRPDATNPWYNAIARHPYNVGYDMNHESAATHYFVGRVAEHWLKEYRLDGFRFDLSKGFTQNNSCTTPACNTGPEVDNWGKYDASRITIWKGYYDTVQAKSGGAYVILEHFAENSEEKELAAYGMMLWGNMNHAFNEATMGYLGGSDFSGGIHSERGWSQPNLVMYMESHDEERLMYKNLQYGNSSGSYSVKDLNTALKRNELAAAFAFAIPGPKMIWQFGELGYDQSINRCTNGTINDNCRTDPKPIYWDYAQQEPRKKLYDAFMKMLKLRQHPLYQAAFAAGTVEKQLSGGFKWLKLTTDTSSLVVAGNFDVTAATGSITFPQTGTWYDYFNGTPLNVNGNVQSITLQPGDYRVYVNRNIVNNPTPVTDLSTINRNFRLAIYPNPVRKAGTIEFELPANGTIALSLLNIQGQRMADLYTGASSKGIHRLPLQGTGIDWDSMPKGIYLLQLRSGEKQAVQKLIIDR